MCTVINNPAIMTKQQTTTINYYSGSDIDIKTLGPIAKLGVGVLSIILIVFMVAFFALYLSLNIIGTIDTIAIVSDPETTPTEEAGAVALNVLGWIVFPLFSVGPIIMRKKQLETI